MKKKKQSFSRLNKTKIARLNSLQQSHILGGTGNQFENTITECQYATCIDDDDDDDDTTSGDIGQGTTGRSADVYCTQYGGNC